MEGPSYKQLFNLSGRTAVVTGGCGILGRHLCSALAEAGCAVAIVDIQSGAVMDFAEQLSDSGYAAAGFVCDVSDPESVDRMVQSVVSRFGGIHVLANNAAAKSSNLDAFFESFENYSLQEWREILSVNLDGMFLMAQAVGKQMLKQGAGGSIIQTSSIYGLTAPDQRIYEGSDYLGRKINSPAVYAVSKWGVVGLTQYLASYWGDKGIRVNAIAPGGVESGQNDEFKRRYSARIPMGRMARAEEIVGAVLYLASDASSYITGQTLAIDGGLTAW